MKRHLLILACAVTMLLLGTVSKAQAWGAYHVGYTHVGAGGVEHYGATYARGPYGGYGGARYGAYGAEGGVYRGGYGAGGAYGGYHYGGAYGGGYAAGGYHYGGAYGGAYGAGVYRRY
jgi:hypothetical protein